MKQTIHNARELFKIRFLRNVLLVAAGGIISMLLIERFVVYPLFSDYLVSITEDDAKRIARHLALDLKSKRGALTSDAIPDTFRAEADRQLETLGLQKFKIFSPAGEILFSTESAEIGTINQKPYFHQRVAKGEIYTLLVQKERKTAEEEIAQADVVETYVPLFNPDGRFAGAFEIYFDITDRWGNLKGLMRDSTAGNTLGVALLLAALFFALTRATAVTVARRKEQVKLQLAADIMANAEEGIMITDAQRRIESVNRAFTELTGYAEQEVRGKTPKILRSGRHSEQFYTNIWDSIENSGFWQGEVWNRRKDGEIYPEWLTITAIKGEKGHIVNYVGMFLDISHFKVKESQLESLAYRDPLTRVPNRLLVKDRLEQNLVAAKRGASKSAVLFLDLDGFKGVNDSFGHSVGDALLLEVTRRFQACIREEDTLGRLGGDEFLICIRKVVQVRECELIAQRLIDSLQERDLIIEGQRCKVGVSIGISTYPEHGDDAEALIHCADIAMYAAKDAGKKCYRRYNPNMEETAATQGTINAAEKNTPNWKSKV